MASTAATPNPSGAPSAKVDELRGVLASKGLVVKDSVLARLAKSKSFKESLTLVQDAERQLESSAQSTENDVQAQNEESGCETSVTQKPKEVEASKIEQEAADKTVSFSGSSGRDVKQLSVSSEGGKVLASNEGLSHSSSEEQKKQRRTKRFGTVSNDEKLKQRASRFGITEDLNEEAEKKRARAARFGIVDEDAKKKARLERFKSSEPEDKEEIEKRKARALRFAPSTDSSLVEVMAPKESLE
ncbi:hypothetical protein GOP47_0024080 [Adiantum capillus-veneris]|uniref:THO1-MOS11 C-terminal domain-containing protein n=1 Tax=Adiantum capillus-veneris TaxID=13818 RepID=A0A9D4U5R0_ADICA|nr:hypothetical protein GOP47_0024080 [Adiantum capillus-veneris]